MPERIPAEAFPPGEFLADELEERGWTQTEFAEIIRRPVKLVNEIIAGRRAITTETARELAAALESTPQYWLNLETAYQLWKTAPRDSNETISREAKLRGRFPVREMIKRRWIAHSENFEVVEKRILDFYAISDVDDEPQLPHAARRKTGEDFSPFQEAWLFRVKQLASALRNMPAYTERKLRQALPELEALLIDPEEIRQVPAIVHGCGVRFVIVEPIPNSKIDGVCFWIDSGRSPVIGLTLKAAYIDRFWFNLRHEIEHVLRGDGKAIIRIDDFDSPQQNEIESEKAANTAAAEFCIPQKSLDDFILRHDPLYSTTKFVGFARVMKRHPGIVAGQLQHKIGRNDLFKKFQPQVREIVTSVALTDGYGKSAPDDI